MDICVLKWADYSANTTTNPRILKQLQTSNPFCGCLSCGCLIFISLLLLSFFGCRFFDVFVVVVFTVVVFILLGPRPSQSSSHDVHKIEWVCLVLRILNLDGHQNCMICLKVLRGWTSKILLR